jgi:hypothetical protein
MEMNPILQQQWEDRIRFIASFGQEKGDAEVHSETEFERRTLGRNLQTSQNASEAPAKQCITGHFPVFNVYTIEIMQ